MKRDNISEEDANNRIKAQMPLADKVARADIVIDNSSDLSQLKVQVKNVVANLRPSTLTWMLEYMGPPAAFVALTFAIKMYAPRLLLYLGDRIAEYSQ